MRKLAVLACVALIGAAPPPEPPAGEGVICMLGLVNAAAEVGRRCFPGQNLEFQAELERDALRIDEYVMKNTPMTPQQLAQFKRDQALTGSPTAEVCGADPVSVYKAFLAGGSEKLRTGTDALLARPGKPTWGDCL